MASIITTNSRSIWNFLKSQGFSEYGVAGLMGNLYAESGLSPINLENNANIILDMSDQMYTNLVDNGTYTLFADDRYGYGLAQWTWHTRKRGLYDYTKSLGVSIGDLNGQLRFLVSELKNYTEVYNTLKTATSVKEASDSVLINFERPADMSDKVKNLRADYGQQFYDQFATKVSEPVYAGGIMSNISNNSNCPEYKVQSGDSLWIIANKYGLSVNDLLKVNPNISANSIIYVGQIILIPTKEVSINNAYNSGSVSSTNTSTSNTSTSKPTVKPNLPKLSTKKKTHPMLERFANKFKKIFVTKE